MVWFRTDPPGAAGTGRTIFVWILPNFVTGVLRLARDMQTLKALFGRWWENFRNLWREKFIGIYTIKRHPH